MIVSKADSAIFMRILGRIFCAYIIKGIDCYAILTFGCEGKHEICWHDRLIDRNGKGGRVDSIAVFKFTNWETVMLSTSAHPAKEKDSVELVSLVGRSHHSTFGSRDAAIR